MKKTSAKQVWGASVKFSVSALEAGAEVMNAAKQSIKEQAAKIDQDKVIKGTNILEDARKNIF